MPKEIVEIIGEGGIISRKKYPVKEDYVIIEKEKTWGKTKIPAWCPSFTEDCFIYYRKRILFFKVLARKLMVKLNSDSCINLKTSPPSVPRMNVEKLFRASVIKNAGASVQKLTVPVFLYLLVFGNLALNVVLFLLLNQRFQFV